MRFRPVAFTPTFDKFAGQSCEGAFLHVTDRDAFRPLLTGLAVWQTSRALSCGRFAWRAHAYEFVDRVPAFDLLCGTAQVRERIEGGLPLASLVEGFEAQLSQFHAVRERYLLYP